MEQDQRDVGCQRQHPDRVHSLKLENAWKQNYTCFILFRVHRLTWHEGMPKDEVWVKLGGDKGGGTFKAGFQLCNVPKPNSPENTCLFCVFEAPDSYVNLHIALDRYRVQVDQVQAHTWR